MAHFQPPACRQGRDKRGFHRRATNPLNNNIIISIIIIINSTILINTIIIVISNNTIIHNNNIISNTIIIIIIIIAIIIIIIAIVIITTINMITPYIFVLGAHLLPHFATSVHFPHRRATNPEHVATVV